MLKIAIFAFAQLAATIYAIARGQAPERLVAAMLMTAMVASEVLPYNDGTNYDRLFLPLLVVDTCLFVGLTGVALLANRFWPMWAAALQLVTVAVHLVKSYDASILPIVYARVSGEIGYVMIAVQIGGVARLRERIERYGQERDWSPFRL